jgi:hypothetical protein
MTDNEISETRADGTKVTRFKPTPAHQTPEAMDRLHTLFWEYDHEYINMINAG